MSVLSFRMPEDTINWIDANKLNDISRSEFIRQIVDEKLAKGMRAIVFVDMTLAMLAGNNRYGNIDVWFDPAELTIEERQELAMQIDEESGCFDATCIDIDKKRYFPKAEATLETLKEVLKERADYRKGVMP